MTMCQVLSLIILRHSRFEKELCPIDVRRVVESGSKTMMDRCRDRVHEILESYQPEPVLEEKLIEELKSFIDRIEKE
jgi:hypothetical protein